MYNPTDNMVENVIYEKKKGSVFGIVTGIIFVLVSVWLLFIVSSWWAIILGIILALLGLVCVGTFFGQQGSFKKFKKYAPFYDCGDAFLEQIATQTNLSTGVIQGELGTLLRDKYLEKIVTYEKTGQIIIASTRSKAQAENFEKYMSFFNDGYFSFSGIAAHVDLSVEALRKELQELANFRAIQTPVIDEENDTIMIQTVSPTVPPTQTGNEAINTLLQEGEVAIATFKRLRESIPDVQVQEKIDEMILVTNGIFKKLPGAPEVFDQVRRFTNYYLPKAMKLLTSYESARNSSVQSEQANNILEQIAAVLDSLVAGFNGIYDSLYKHKALDIETDIEVLEMMLKRDGVHGEDDFRSS